MWKKRFKSLINTRLLSVFLGGQYCWLEIDVPRGTPGIVIQIWCKDKLVNVWFKKIGRF